MPDFERALRFVLKREGGWHPGNLRTDPEWTLAKEKRDPHPTMKGVTQTTYDAYRTGKGLATRSVKGIEESELREIYKVRYWNPVVRESHSEALAINLFDASVNFGPGVPQTWLKLTERPECILLIREAVYRWMAKTSTRHRSNLPGWLNRINALYREVGITREKPFSA